MVRKNNSTTVGSNHSVNLSTFFRRLVCIFIGSDPLDIAVKQPLILINLQTPGTGSVVYCAIMSTKNGSD